MPQPKIRSDQLNSGDFGTITSDGLTEALGAPVAIGSPIANGESLTFDGTNWTNSSGGGSGVTAGDGLGSTGGSPVGTQVLSVDSTVARTDVTTETFSFAGAVSLNLNDTSQGADEDIWRVGVTGSSFVISTRTDADGAGNSAITFARTGATVDTVTIPAPTHLTATGTGTSSALHLSSNAPTLVFNDNDAAVNAGIWDITSGTNQLLFRTRTDVHGTGATGLTVNRSGTAVGALAFTGTSMTFNGLPVIVGGSPYVGGGAGDGAGSPIGNPLELAPSKTSGASLRIPDGTAPSAPVQGDLYSTTQGLFFVGHGSPHVTHDLTHKVVAVASSGVLNANNTITNVQIPGMRVDFISPPANYLCEIWIRGRQNVPEAGLRVAVDSAGFGGSITWTLTEYDSSFSYGPITTTTGGSPITYPGGDTNSNDAQIRGMDFGEQNNVTTASVLMSTYNDSPGEFVLRGEGYLTTGGGQVMANVLAAQGTATIGNTQYSYTGAGRAWMKLTRITH